MIAFFGKVFEQLPEGEIGRPILATRITFIDAESERSSTIQSDQYGYCVDLLPGSYLVRAKHPLFIPFTTEPRLIQVQNPAEMNILLRRQTLQGILVNSLFYGRVLQYMNGQASYGIADVAVTFINPINGQAKTVGTDEQGYYQIELAIGSYIVTAVHPQFELFSTDPGLIFLHPQPTLINIFLEAPPVATTQSTEFTPYYPHRRFPSQSQTSFSDYGDAPDQNDSSPNKIFLKDIKYDPNAIPIWELAARISAKVPDEEWAKVPSDLSQRFDYYQGLRDDS